MDMLKQTGTGRRATMASSPYLIPLHRGNLARRGIAAKGVMLNQAARAGIAVPRSMILLDDAWQYARTHDMLAGPADVLVPRDIQAFIHVLKIFQGLTELGPRIAVRGLYNAENETALRLQGVSVSKLRVDRRDPQGVATAICTLWSAAGRFARVQRRDLLLMTMVEPQHAGVVVMESAYEDDVVNFTGGTADPLVQGHVAGISIQLARVRHGEAATADVPFARRLQELIRQVRQVFGDYDWEIEWADDGQTCWLLQIRPLLHAIRRNDHFAGGTLQHLMPDHMSYFMAQLYHGASDDMYHYYRQFDASLPDTRRYVELFAGQPRYNYSLLADTLRRWGLPGIVSADLNNATMLMVTTQRRRLGRSWWRLLRLAWDSLRRAPQQVQHLRRLYQRVQRFHNNLDEMVMILHDVVVVLHASMAALGRIIGPLEHWMRRRRVYTEWIARYPTLTRRIHADLAPIRTFLDMRPDIADQLRDRLMPSDAMFVGMWEEVLSRHGYRAVAEGDIATPRFREESSMVQQLLFQAVVDAPPPPLTFRAAMAWPAWQVLRWALLQRDAVQAAAMQVIDRLRRLFLQQAERAVERRALPFVGAIWYLSPEEFVHACEGVVIASEVIAQRRATQQELADLHVPLHVTRFEDPLTWHRERSHMRVILEGTSINAGVVHGRAWRPLTPTATPPADIVDAERILVVRQFDAQWVEAAQACVAVIAESGAELSNGAMILRTLGVPAMIAVRGCYDAMPTTTELVVAASYAYVEIKRALPNLLPQPRPVPMLPELGVTRAFRMITGEVRRD